LKSADDPGSAVGVERLPAGGLDHEAEPVGVDAVLVERARVGDQRIGEHPAVAGERVRRAGQLLEAQDVLAPEPVREPAGVAASWRTVAS